MGNNLRADIAIIQLQKMQISSSSQAGKGYTLNAILNARRIQMAKPTVKRLDEGQLEMMWNFLRMGYQKPNIPALKENLDAIRQMMIQKTAGQDGYSTNESISFDDLQTHINCVAIETMCLYLSGALDKLEEE
jgi:hypothetical protein